MPFSAFYSDCFRRPPSTRTRCSPPLPRPSMPRTPPTSRPPSRGAHSLVCAPNSRSSSPSPAHCALPAMHRLHFRLRLHRRQRILRLCRPMHWQRPTWRSWRCVSTPTTPICTRRRSPTRRRYAYNYCHTQKNNHFLPFRYPIPPPNDFALFVPFAATFSLVKTPGILDVWTRRAPTGCTRCCAPIVRVSCVACWPRVAARWAACVRACRGSRKRISSLPRSRCESN